MRVRLPRFVTRWLGASAPELYVDPAQEETRRRLGAIFLHGVHAELGRELTPRRVEAAGDVATFVTAGDCRRATTNTLIVDDIGEDSTLLAIFEGDYNQGASSFAGSLVAAALCDAVLACTTALAPPATEQLLRDALAAGAGYIRALETATAPDDIWDDFTRTQVLGPQATFRGLGTSLTAALRVGNTLCIAHVGETAAYRIALDATCTRLTASHRLEDHPRTAGNDTVRGALARWFTASSPADVDFVRTTLSPGDTFLLLTSSLHSASIAPTAATAASDPLTLIETLRRAATSARIPAAAVVARFG